MLFQTLHCSTCDRSPSCTKCTNCSSTCRSMTDWLADNWTIGPTLSHTQHCSCKYTVPDIWYAVLKVLFHFGADLVFVMRQTSADSWWWLYASVYTSNVKMESESGERWCMNWITKNNGLSEENKNSVLKSAWLLVTQLMVAGGIDRVEERAKGLVGMPKRDCMSFSFSFVL